LKELSIRVPVSGEWYLPIWDLKPCLSEILRAIPRLEKLELCGIRISEQDLIDGLTTLASHGGLKNLSLSFIEFRTQSQLQKLWDLDCMAMLRRLALSYLALLPLDETSNEKERRVTFHGQNRSKTIKEMTKRAHWVYNKNLVKRDKGDLSSPELWFEGPYMKEVMKDLSSRIVLIDWD
jgi:hypothetical protein